MAVLVATSGVVDVPVRVSAKTDYAVRAMIELASAGASRRLKAERIATAQAIPLKFLLNIMTDLRHARIVLSRRGADGGFQLARPADQISLGEVIRAVEGPLTTVEGIRPQDLQYRGAAQPLREVWLAVQTSLEEILEGVTLADLVLGPPPAPSRPDRVASTR